MRANEIGVTFIGSGMIAQAIVRRLVTAGVVKADSVTCTDTDVEKAEALQADLGVAATSDNVEAVRGAGCVWVCVPPLNVVSVLLEIGEAMERDALVVSVAAGVTLQTIAAALPSGISHCRVMPNTPSLIGRGFNAVCYGAVTSDKRAMMERFLAALGGLVDLPESQFDAFCALCAVGPTYVLPILDSLQKAAVKHGLSPELSLRGAAAVVAGTAHLVAEAARPLEELKRMISLRPLDEGRADQLFQEAFGQAMERLKALGDRVSRGRAE